LFAPPSQADEIADLLQSILAETQAILYKINLLPTYIEDITKMAHDFNVIDDKSNVIANLQANFATLTYNDYTSHIQQIDLSNMLTKRFLMAGGDLPSNAYELGYSILTNGNNLVAPIPGENLTAQNQKRKEGRDNYLAYISGSNIIFKQVEPSWSSSAKKNYQSIYNTIAAISSYNAFILSDLYTNQANEDTRLSLIDQATNSSWFKTVSSEALGLVLRHTLMYMSQIYVELDQMIKLQQKQVTAQAMTNTLLILYANFSIAQNVSAAAGAQMMRPGQIPQQPPS